MELALETAARLGFEKDNHAKAADVFIKLYKLFKEKDATQIEINPLAEVEGGQVLCMDAKLGFDDNADFRQKVRRDPSLRAAQLLTRPCALAGYLCAPRFDAGGSLGGRGGQVWPQLHQAGWVDWMPRQRCWTRDGDNGRAQPQRR